MAIIIKVLGTKRGEKVYLAQVRKATDKTGKTLPQKPGEVAHSNQAGQLIEYRKRLSSNNLTDFQLNKITMFEFKDKKDPTKVDGRKFSLIISKNEKSYIIDLGGNMVSKGTLNSLCSLLNYSKEEIADAKFSFSVYTSKTGKNYGAIYMNGEPLEWTLSLEEQSSLVDVTKNKKGEVTDVDDDALIEELMKRINGYDDVELGHVQGVNDLLPKSAYAGNDGFDDLDDDKDEAPVSNEPAPTPFDDEPTADDNLDEEL